MTCPDCQEPFTASGLTSHRRLKLGARIAPPRVPQWLQVTEQMADAIQERAKAEGVPMAEVCRRALAIYLAVTP